MKEINCSVEVSARHIHLSKKDYEFLFGADAAYTAVKRLSQVGDFATDKKVTIIGPEGEVIARFVGPFRAKTQVELSLTDCYQIGIKAPYSHQADDQAAEIKIQGEIGEIIRKAAIVTKRHLHLSPLQAAKYGISKDSILKLTLDSPRGKTIYFDIKVKIADNYRLAVHLDTDEGNAAGIISKTIGKLEIIS